MYIQIDVKPRRAVSKDGSERRQRSDFSSSHHVPVAGGGGCRGQGRREREKKRGGGQKDAEKHDAKGQKMTISVPRKCHYAPTFSAVNGL